MLLHILSLSVAIDPPQLGTCDRSVFRNTLTCLPVTILARIILSDNSIEIQIVQHEMHMRRMFSRLCLPSHAPFKACFTLAAYVFVVILPFKRCTVLSMSRNTVQQR